MMIPSYKRAVYPRAMSPFSNFARDTMQLNAKTTALVLIDLQKGILAVPVLPNPASTVYARSKALASRLRAAGGPIVWVRVSFARHFRECLARPSEPAAPYEALPAGVD